MIELDDGDVARLASLYARLAPRLPAIADRFREQAGIGEAGEIDDVRCLLVEWMAAGLGGSAAAASAMRSRLAREHACWRMPQLFDSIHRLRDDYDDQIAELFEPAEGALVRKSVNKLLDRELAAMTRQHVDHTASSDRVAAMQTLSMGLAHELRNPVNSARLHLELIERRLESGPVADAKVIDGVHAITDELARLTRLLAEFLSFARPAELSARERDLAPIIHSVVTAERPLAASRGITLEERDPAVLVAHVDGSKVQQIVQNLVRNAIEACRAGGHVAVSARAEGAAIRIDVEDDGPGISEATRRRMFEPFFTTKDAGTGLGLAIVHSYVTLHGGHIELHSTGRGSRFEITLPQPS